MISAWVQKLIAATRPSQQVEPEANEIFKVLCGKCPKCGKTLGDHFYQLFAVIATDGRKEKLSDFIRNARDHNWETLSRYQTFDPLKNPLEAFALRCPDSSLTLLLVRDPSELYDSKSVENVESLDQDENFKWSPYLSADKWKSF
jgi:hypothetical protein